MSSRSGGISFLVESPRKGRCPPKGGDVESLLWRYVIDPLIKGGAPELFRSRGIYLLVECLKSKNIRASEGAAY